MNRKNKLLMLLMIVFLLSACSEENNKNSSQEANNSENTEVETDKINTQISNMSIDEKISQLLIIGIEGYELSQDEIDLINKYNFSGYIFFDRNIETKEQFTDLINNIKTENKKNVPCFLCIDEEGGRVERLDKFFKAIPPMNEIGNKNNAELAFKVGTVLGEKLQTFGLNMDFAPVLDINSNPSNQVIGDRSFSNDPDVVARLGNELAKGISNQNIVAAGKHFPGHGDTETDSHYDLPVINKDLDDLENLELKPFIYNINNGLRAIMAGHLFLPQISSEPSSLSNEIINDLLREKLKFNGVVLSDDMTMGAIVDNYDIRDAILKFYIAGGDIALVCHDNSKIPDIIDYIKLALEKGTISETEINEKLYRILTLKNDYEINNDKIDYSLVENHIEKINTEINNLNLEVE